VANRFEGRAPIRSARRRSGRNGGIALTTNEDLLHASAAVRRALLDNDVDALGRLVADDYCGFDPTGCRQDRPMLLEAYGPGGVQLLKYETSDVTTRIVGDVGLVMGLGALKGRYGDHTFEHNLRFLDVYVHRGSAWLLLVSQVTELPKGP
jgi:ketosteroid isomerase-like protein